MNIAEIRKKARVGISNDQSHGAGVSGDSMNHRNISPDDASSISLSQETVPAKGMFAPLLASSLTNLSAEKEDLVSGEDRLDQLFSWIPQQEDLLLETAANPAAETKKVETVSRRWLAFSLGNEDYALDISQIREILKPREITEIPRVPEFLLGIISLRGNIIPIFDLKRRLGLGAATIDQHSRIIVCQEGDRLAGLLIDRITQVTSIQEEKIEATPAIFSGRDRALLDGVGRVQDNILILLNLANVLSVDTNSL